MIYLFIWYVPNTRRGWGGVGGGREGWLGNKQVCTRADSERQREKMSFTMPPPPIGSMIKKIQSLGSWDLNSDAETTELRFVIRL